MSKNRNSTNFDATKIRPKFLTSDDRIAFNHLQLTFIEALIFQHVDPECHIWIETDILSYTINVMLSQLTFETSLNGLVTKTNLSK